MTRSQGASTNTLQGARKQESSPTATIELETSRGHVLRLREGFDPALLRRVLEALASC